MEKLTLEHLAPYLPYDLRIKDGTSEFTMDGSFLHQAIEYPLLYKDFKPILTPLEDFIGSEADKEIFGKGTYNMDSKINYKECLYYWEVQILLKHHFDIFGLLERGLAVSIHDIPNQNNDIR